MRKVKIAAITLIVVGTLGLVLGQFALGTETHRASIGAMDMAITDQRIVDIPLWAAVGAIAAGVILLLPLGRGRG